MDAFRPLCAAEVPVFKDCEVQLRGLEVDCAVEGEVFVRVYEGDEGGVGAGGLVCV